MTYVDISSPASLQMAGLSSGRDHIPPYVPDDRSKLSAKFLEGLIQRHLEMGNPHPAGHPRAWEWVAMIRRLYEDLDIAERREEREKEQERNRPVVPYVDRRPIEMKIAELEEEVDYWRQSLSSSEQELRRLLDRVDWGQLREDTKNGMIRYKESEVLVAQKSLLRAREKLARLKAQKDAARG